MKYYSRSRDEHIDVKDMHIEHLANALERGTREETLRKHLHQAMVIEYISRTREERKVLRGLPVGRLPKVSDYRALAIRYLKRWGEMTMDDMRTLASTMAHPIYEPALDRVFKSGLFEGRVTWDPTKDRAMTSWRLA